MKVCCKCKIQNGFNCFAKTATGEKSQHVGPPQENSYLQANQCLYCLLKNFFA